MIRLAWRLLGALSLAMAAPALAGPPYQTDDPAPTDLKHWEIYNFVDVDGAGSDFAGEGGLDLNYGAAPELQLTATLPLAFTHQEPGGWNGGAGDVELGAKYRFAKDENGGLQAAIFPRLILPTSAADLGGRRTRLLLPLWVQKDFGRTSLFGGGGFEINPGSGNRNFWQAGIAATHDFTDRLQLGAELYWQSADIRGGDNLAGADIGMIRKLGGPFELLAAGGPTFTGGRSGYHAYAALGLNF